LTKTLHRGRTWTVQWYFPLVHNLRQCVLPWAHLSPQPKWHLDRFTRLCTAHGTMSLCMSW